MISLIKTYICGCVRNVAPYLYEVFQNIDNIITTVDDYTIIMSYDDSDDASLNILQSLQKKYGEKMIIIIGNIPLTDTRTQNISNARNRIMEKIRKLNNSEFEYFIMLDTDDVCSKPINIDVLNYIWNKEKTTPLLWDALTFNRSKYYDLWALSIYPYSFSCFHYPRTRLIRNKMHTHIQNLLRDTAKKYGNNGLLECFSAFNGFGIYRVSKFKNINYEWNIHKLLEIIPKENITTMSNSVLQTPFMREDDCEHRYFHIRASQMNQARICISPMYLFY